MSDFLGHLVARSLELAPAVQPRLASLFEPTALEGTIAPGFGLDSPERHASPAPARPAEAAPPPEPREAEPVPHRRRRKTAEPPPPAEIALPVEVEDADRSTLLPPPPAPVRPAKARPVEAREEDRERTLGESLRRPASLDRAAAPGREGRREDPPALQPLLLPRIEIPRLPEPLPLRASMNRSEATEPPRRKAAEIRPVEPGPPPVPAPGIVVQPRIERAAALAPPPGTLEAPAPTIQVTIGRIEVRATAPQAAAAPARRASAPAGMTLDEYLRRRDGERR